MKTPKSISSLLYRSFFVSLVAMFALAFVATSAVDVATAGYPRHDDSSSIVSKTLRADGGQAAAMYTVPMNKSLRLTQACVEHGAMYVAIGAGVSFDRVSFSGQGCTQYQPGFALAGGTRIRCVNKSGQARSCAVVGVLVDGENAGPNRKNAKFFDVDEELGRR